MAGSTCDLIMLWVAAVGQVLFVVLWATQRWWVTRVGRALMVKSAALAVILSASLWTWYRGPLPTTVGRVMFGAVVVGIVGQLLAVSLEIWQAWRQRRPVSGTNDNYPRRKGRR